MIGRWGKWVATAALCVWAGSAAGAEAIKIGEINSYTGPLAAFTEPYRNGWTLALEQVNAAGGIGGRPLEVIARDDAGKAGTAIRHAQELVSGEGVALLMGTFLSNVGLAVSDFAKQNRILFVAAEPLTDAMTWSKGNRYTFRLRPSTYMQAAMLAEEAAKLPAKRWASVAPNYEYGQSFVQAFRELLAKKRPDVEWVGEQWPALWKIDAGATVQALARMNPEAIFNVTFSSDLAKFVREGNLRGLFEGRTVVSPLTGEPEYMEPLKAEAPKDWIVTGYPWYAVETPAHKAYLEAYKARFGDHPRLGSLVGYNTMLAVAAALNKAGSTDTDALVTAMTGLEIDTPVGRVVFRASDHQSTMGAFVGRTAVRDGAGEMVDWRYVDGAEVLPSDDEVRALRPAE